MTTQAQLLLTALLAAFAGIGVLMLWLGLFAQPSPIPIQKGQEAEESPSILQRIRAYYEETEPPLPFDVYILISFFTFFAFLIIGIFSGLFFFFAVIGLAAPFIIYQFLVARHDARMNDKRRQLIEFIRDYADTLRLFKNPQQTNLELASRARISGNNYFYTLIQEANESIAKGEPFAESMLALAPRFRSAIWKQFIQLVVGTSERGVPIADALKALAEYANQQYLLLNKFAVYRNAENNDATIMFLMAVGVVFFISRNAVFASVSSHPIAIIAQVFSALLCVGTWFFIRQIGKRGIFTDTADRVTFTPEQVRKFRKEIDLAEEYIPPRFVFSEKS